MNILFCLYHYNDIDHITPVIWKCLESGDVCTVTFLNPTQDFSKDPRLDFLKKYENYRERAFSDYVGTSFFSSELFFPLEKKYGLKHLWRKFLERSGISIGKIKNQLRKDNIDAVIFEWGGTGSRNRLEMFLAAESLSIPTIVLPHGLNIFLNSDMTQTIGKKIRNGKPIHASRNRFDAYVFQSQFHLEQEMELGLSKTTAHALGSARFCPEWAPINASLYKPHATSRDDSKTKIVFMLPHWTYNVEQEKTLQCIERILSIPGVYLLLKPHTRNSHIIPESLLALMKKYPESGAIETQPSSTALIRWSDIVVCFGSSIGLDALLHNTPLINPTFCHGNHTIFEHWGGEWNVNTPDDMENLILKKPHQVLDDSHPLVTNVIFGGQSAYDVLGGYVNLIHNTILKKS